VPWPRSRTASWSPVWHVLSTQTPYRDLGGDYFLRRDNPENRRRRALDQLERLGYRIILEPAA